MACRRIKIAMQIYMETVIIAIVVPGGYKIEDKGKKKVEKYQDLKRDVTRLSDVRKMLVNPAGVDALGFVSKTLNKWMEQTLTILDLKRGWTGINNAFKSNYAF